ncbi:kinase-like protein [Trichocladium antarcticum]|uniref:non-specific serine/threonine protein kinase n=1 Tax=Trichocladium antarcticum TaxID=1450529 RepID=A0AAN6UQH2_9PEZI|nr:kinase-like protein [Trichocladium antarcticum]
MDCLRDNFYDGVIIGDRYQTISPLNHGSFGMVFMAKDLKTNQTVAIKCLTKPAANDEGFQYAIDDQSEELELHTRLGAHPNIVSLLDSFETEAHSYLVLEFCPRGDLYEAIRMDHGPLETEHVRRFMLELVDAVQYMHDKGIYHRDIKPENIFLTQSGAMKLGDFGLATTEEWSYEVMVGSDRYMSPEQYDSAGAGYSPAQADVWAVGICLLNILFSRNPFTIPTEEDPLFLDFSRDKQSLFDVFPSMSQDTYEVIVQSMNLDPTKRSLSAVREALLRVVSFTTLDEALDDFCSTERRVVASSNREPLRTPSIQSPQVDNGAFPWAKALHATPPKPIRQLSVIPDDEIYDEDLFSKSGTTTDWMSGTAHTPSMASYFDSTDSLGLSIESFRPKLPAKALARAGAVAESLPITMSKNRIASSMALNFDRKDAVSKSWSDLWDEEFEEEEATQLQTLKEMNSRTWSHGSNVTPSLATADNDDTPRQGLSPATKTASLANDENKIPSIDDAFGLGIDEDLDADDLFFYEAPPAKEEPQLPAPHSPPSKRSDVDKWTALGERRRAFGDSSPPKVPKGPLRMGRHVGTGFPASSPIRTRGLLDMMNNDSHPTPSFVYAHHSPQHNHQHAPQHRSPGSRERGGKECPWGKSRDRDWNSDWRKEKRNAFGLAEWVGNWQATRS